MAEYIYSVDPIGEGEYSHTLVGELVRCKDCKWGDWYTALDGNRYCYCLETDRGGRTAEDYCSYGERRADK